MRLFYITFMSLLLAHCDARKSVLLSRKLSTPRSQNMKHLGILEMAKNLNMLIDVSMKDSSNAESAISSPFTLPPYNSLAPNSYPDSNNSPPFCVYPPPNPQSPSTTIPTPDQNSPTPPSNIPPSPFGIVPSPTTPNSSPSPFGIVPTPTTPDVMPGPPEYVPSPPSFEPSPPSGEIPSPSPPSGEIPSPPSGGIPSPNPPSGEIPSPPSGEIPSPNPPSGEIPSPPSSEIPSPPEEVPSPIGFEPSPSVFEPPVVYPPPTVPSSPPSGGGGSGGTVWCVAKPSVPDPIIQEAMNYACGSGADCGPIQPNGQCFQPNTLLAHASYAFNSFWQRTKVAGGTCSFGGTAILVTVNPSSQGCHFVSY